MPKSKRAGGTNLSTEQHKKIAAARVAMEEVTSRQPGFVVAIIGIIKSHGKKLDAPNTGGSG